MVFKIHMQTLADSRPRPQACGLSEPAARVRVRRMFGFKSNKGENRFYLFPGQGGPALRRKRKKFLIWSVIVALFVSAVFSALLYWLSYMKMN
jgi:hypothetical protein